MRVTVEQRHIDRGIPGDRHICPVVIAIIVHLAEEGAENPEVEVAPYAIYIGDRELPVPVQVRDIIEDYDDGGKMYPFSFILEEE